MWLENLTSGRNDFSVALFSYSYIISCGDGNRAVYSCDLVEVHHVMIKGTFHKDRPGFSYCEAKAFTFVTVTAWSAQLIFEVQLFK